MAGRKTKLTDELQQQIVSYIRAGAYDWVAAQATGIGKTTFYRWMQAGERGRQPYAGFFAVVREARAVARVAAEMEVKRDNPLAWLRYGPGRAKPEEPGWTESHELSIVEGATITLNLSGDSSSDPQNTAQENS